MYYRPDRPLVVKCSLDTSGWKKITFSSARNCSYEVLRHKVEQCFSLSSTSFAIAYKDDDGEITNIAAESDLTEAIQYFQAGDDTPLSSAASILSGRSFGGRKVTLRVHVLLDYDGPSLSDTSSLVSLDEYRDRNGSQQSFSFVSPSADLDDDSVTVSSRGNSALSASLGASHRVLSTLVSHPTTVSHTKQHFIAESGRPPDGQQLPDSEPEDSSAVFERLKRQEAWSDDQSSVDYDSPVRNDRRGAAWLRDQNERTMRARLGLPEPSLSDEISLAPQTQEELGGALELERDPRGKYYYTYTSAGPDSQNYESGYDDGLSGPANIDRPRPSSMQLNWLASQQIQLEDVNRSLSHSQHPDLFFTQRDSLPPSEGTSRHSIDQGLLRFLPIPVPPSESLTDCSECGTLLDGIRYVCSTCGEKQPARGLVYSDEEGRAALPLDHTYQPSPYLYPLSSPPVTPMSSQTYVGSSDSLSHQYRTLPSSPNLTLGATSIKGYELCSRCLQSAGVHHAIEVGLATGSPPSISSPTSQEDSQAASQWRRAAPKKGQLRHAYHEKVWGHNGWEDVQQDEAQISKCSTCKAITPRRRYKCASCPNINLCRACYSQVHELHPSHAFLTVPDRRVRAPHESDHPSKPTDTNDEQSLKHPGVSCAHCLLDIVGARFHCAICDSVNICANCESAGLPGNLDSADGGHNSSHILIKIPYPLETTELESASRWALRLWTRRDAASVGVSTPRSRPGSVISSYARTVVGSRSRGSEIPADDHLLFCNGCNHRIIGIRYQCANCPSLPRAYNLCQNCEPRSYNLHDPMHVFFKLPRPVRRPIESTFPMMPLLYKKHRSVGPESSCAADPKAYLQSLVHPSALCDRCMIAIQGEWFRCAYCALDLCDACEEVDTHDDSHVFIVFKFAVDMQIFKTFANLDIPDGIAPAVIPYPVYR